MTKITAHGAPEKGSGGPSLSSAIRAGDTLYLSGVLGTIPGSRDLAEGGIEGQTRQTMENMKAVLESCNSSLDRVVKCTVFLADMADWPGMNKVYGEFFETPPARSAVAVAGMALNGLVEIECIAIVND